MSHAARRNHILTIHLEDYFQVKPVSTVVPQRYWPRFETRVERNTLAALDLLDQAGHKATFFAVGWIADQIPEVIAEVARRGHEVASKGYHHRSISQMSPEEFRADAVRSRIALERAANTTVRGYRIARGWFSLKDLWALDILAEEGFDYDASLRPLGIGFAGQSHRRYLHKHKTDKGEIWELPLSSSNMLGFSLPVSGGNYIRQFPDSFMRQRIATWDKTVDAPLVFYFHVWELDPEQPRITATPVISRLRQYRNLDVMPERIRKYLNDYSFVPASDYLKLPPKPVQVALAPAEVKPDLWVAATNRRPVTVVVPCYNEEPTLKYLANTLQRFEEVCRDELELSYLFIDDGSSDKTWEYLNNFFGQRANVELIRHPKNRGVAAATMTGLKNAKTETVCVIDCDCSYDPEHLMKMVPMLAEGVDLVTASPYHKEGSVLNVPGWRLVLSRGLSLLYRMTLKNKLATYTACFRVYRRSSVSSLSIDNLGYLGIAEILARLDARGAKIVECPAVLESRLLGSSKMKIVRTIVGHLGLLTTLLTSRQAPQALHRKELVK